MHPRPAASSDTHSLNWHTPCASVAQYSRAATELPRTDVQSVKISKQLVLPPSVPPMAPGGREDGAREGVCVRSYACSVGVRERVGARVLGVLCGCAHGCAVVLLCWVCVRSHACGRACKPAHACPLPPAHSRPRPRMPNVMMTIHAARGREAQRESRCGFASAFQQATGVYARAPSLTNLVPLGATAPVAPHGVCGASVEGRKRWTFAARGERLLRRRR